MRRPRRPRSPALRRPTTRRDGVCGVAGAGADHRRRLRVRLPRRQGQLLRYRGAYMAHTPLHMRMHMLHAHAHAHVASRPALHDHTRACSPLTTPPPPPGAQQGRRLRLRARGAPAARQPPGACPLYLAIPRYTSLYLPVSPDTSLHLTASPARHAPGGRARLLLLWRSARPDGALRLLRRAAGCGC